MDVLLNWQNIGAFALAAFVAAHVLMYLVRNKPVAHSFAVYIATLVGGLSLLLQLYQSDEKLAKWWRPSVELRRMSALEMLKDQIEWERQYYCERPKAVRSEYSPANFDQIVAANAATCQTMRALALRSKGWPSGTEDIALPELQAPHFQMPMPQQSAQSLREVVGYYNASASELRRLDGVSAPTPLLQTITILGPYAFISAFMIGLANIAFPVGSPDRKFREALGKLLKGLRRSAGSS